MSLYHPTLGYSLPDPSVDPDVILSGRPDSLTPAALFLHNPYLRAAVAAYDEHRFDHSLIAQLGLTLYSFAKDRFKNGKKTGPDLLIQEAMKRAREMVAPPPAPRAERVGGHGVYGGVEHSWPTIYE